MAVGTITTQFLIGGQLLPSFMSSMTKANQQMIKLQRTAASGITSIAGFTKGLTGIGVATAGIAAVTAAVAAMGKVFGEALEAGKKEQNYINVIGNELRNVNQILGLNAKAWKGMTDDIVHQSYLLEEQSGIYHQVYLKGAAILAQGHASHAAIVEILKSSKDLMATQKMMGKTDDEMARTYEAITKALMGQPRGLKAVGIYLDYNQQKLLSHLTALGYWDKAIDMITKAMGANKGAAKEFLATPAGKEAAAFNKWQDTLTKLGDAHGPLARVDLRLREMMYTLGTSIFGSPEMMTFVNWLDTQMESIYRFFNRGLPILDKNIHAFVDGFKKGWKTAFGEDLETSVTRATEFIKTTFKTAFDFVMGLPWKDIGSQAAATIKDFADEIKGMLKDIKSWNEWLKQQVEPKGGKKPSFIPQKLWDAQQNAKKSPIYSGPSLYESIMTGNWKDSFWAKSFGHVPWRTGPPMSPYQAWLGSNPEARDPMFRSEAGKRYESEKKLTKSVDTLNQTIIDWHGGIGLFGMLPYPGSGGRMGRSIYQPGGGIGTQHGLPGHLPLKPGSSMVFNTGSNTGYKVWEQGPAVGDYKFWDLHGPSRQPLVADQEVGLSPDLLKKYGLRADLYNLTKGRTPDDWVNIEGVGWRPVKEVSNTVGGIEFMTGKAHRYDVVPYRRILGISHGPPNFTDPMPKSKAEQRGGKGGEPELPPGYKGTPSNALLPQNNVTINYNVHHGGGDEHRLAEHDRRHLLHLKQMVEDIVYDRNRRSYVPRVV